MSSGQKTPGRAAKRRRRENLILVGLRGCGKTVVGQMAAKRLGWSFVDTDERVERAAGRSLSNIFATEGEAAFRELESRAIAEAVDGHRQVISAGGGAVLSDGNRKLMRAAGVCVWLVAPPAELHRRVQADRRTASQRPALTATGGLEEVCQVLAIRGPLYQAVADAVVDTSGRTVDAVAEELVALVTERLVKSEGA